MATLKFCRMCFQIECIDIYNFQSETESTIHSDIFENVKTGKVDRWKPVKIGINSRARNARVGQRQRVGEKEWSLDVHTTKSNAGDGAHARVFDRDTGGFVSRGSYRRTLSSSSRSSAFPRLRPAAFVVSRRDSHFLERLTPSVDPCRRRSPTISLSPLRRYPRSDNESDEGRRHEGRNAKRFSFSMLYRAALFSTIQLVASSWGTKR